MTIKVIEKNQKEDLKALVSQADEIIINTIRKINHEHIMMCWNIGEMINKYKIENNSKYGDRVVEQFSEELTKKYGRGFNNRSVERMCRFNNIIKIASTSTQSDREKKKKGSTSAQSQKTNVKKSSPARILEKDYIFVNDSFEFFKNLTWSHIIELLSVDNPKMLLFYVNEINTRKLSKYQIRELIKTKSFERTIANQRGKAKNKLETTLKDPMILGIENKKRSEKQLEDEIVKNILPFMGEIGNSIAYHSRQLKINVNGVYHKVDLVFIDIITRTYILIDLKINKVTNKDIMQMKIYTEYFAKDSHYEKFNVVGLILCETKDLRMIEDDNIYQIKYLNEVPKEKELLRIINENKIILLKSEDFNI